MINSLSLWRPAKSSGASNRQAGQAAVLFALALVALIGFAGLALDAGLSYMAQTGLQSASDNASLAAARMLAADYQAQVSGTPGTPLPWTYGDIVATVKSVVGANSVAAAGNTTNTWAGYFTDTAGTALCQFWPTTAATCTGLPVSPTGTLAANGARIVYTNTHSTNLLNVLGIGTARETAPATAIFGVTYGLAGGKFAVYQLDCLTNSAVKVNEQIIYYGPSWQKAWSCDNVGDSNFKGDLHSVSPDPVLVENWASAKSGSGPITPVASGSTILIPMIDCLGHGKQCSEPVSPGICPTSLPSGLKTSGNDVMCVIGIVALKALGTGTLSGNTVILTNPGATCTTGHTCVGEVVPFISDQAGVLICPTTQEPSCGDESGTQGQENLAIELLN